MMPTPTTLLAPGIGELETPIGEIGDQPQIVELLEHPRRGGSRDPQLPGQVVGADR